MSIRKSFVITNAVTAGLMALLVGVWVMVTLSQDAVQGATEARYRSYLLADELRQSSDDLTRLARTYVVSGDASYEQQYNDVLDIRNGKKPRPLDYNRIYWDFMAVGKKPRGDGETVPLQTLMKQAGFTDQEFDRLRQAQANSDGLVKLEVVAMNAVKGLFEDATGKFTVRKDPDFELARKLMHSKEYHQFKAEIMAPVDEFLALLDTRTAAAVAGAHQRVKFWQGLFAVLFVLLAASIGATTVLLYRRCIVPLGGLTAVLTKLAGGQNDVGIPESARADEIGGMARSIEVLRDHAVEAAAAAAAQAAEDAGKEKRRAAVEAHIKGFDASVGSTLGILSTAAKDLQTTSRTLSSAAEQADRQADAMSAASQNASSNVQTVASAAEELSASISEISRRVIESAQRTGQGAGRRRPADRRRGQAHQRHRRADEPAGPQRHDRGGACGRGGQGLRGGGVRGEEPRQPDGQGDRGHRQTGQGDPERHVGFRRRDQRHHRHHRQDQRDRHVDRLGGRGAGGRDQRDRPQRSACRRRHDRGVEQHRQRHAGRARGGCGRRPGAVGRRRCGEPRHAPEDRRRAVPYADPCCVSGLSFSTVMPATSAGMTVCDPRPA
jgi:methyl-accepting chemotaxis protein